MEINVLPISFIWTSFVCAIIKGENINEYEMLEVSINIMKFFLFEGETHNGFVGIKCCL